jgi:hypothetical protein
MRAALAVTVVGIAGGVGVSGDHEMIQPVKMPPSKLLVGGLAVAVTV